LLAELRFTALPPDVRNGYAFPINYSISREAAPHSRRDYKI